LSEINVWAEFEYLLETASGPRCTRGGKRYTAESALCLFHSRPKSSYRAK